MKFDHLLHFLETARQEHLTKAAANLRTSPSALSYSIDCLEEELGVELFEKRGKRIFLTEAGRRLLKQIPEVQRSLSQLRKQVTEGRSGYEGHYRLGASHLLAESVLAPIVASLFGKTEAVTADIYSLNSAEVLARIVNEQLEVGVCFSPQNHPLVTAHVLHQGDLKVYVRPGHPCLKGSGVLKRLSEYPAVLPKAFSGIEVCETHEVFKIHGVKPRARFAFNHYGIGTALIKKSDAWGFFPDWMADLPGFPLRNIPLPTTWKAPYTICALHLKDRFVDGGLELLLKYLRSALTPSPERVKTDD
jgi:DNA-binding transcriptional LysR family regulator